VPTSTRAADNKPERADFVAFAVEQAEAAIGKWILGNTPFTAKLHPEFALYGDYDQLMRLQEWNGRQAIIEDAA
jgi:ATP-dependent helicase/nuclease subunit B